MTRRPLEPEQFARAVALHTSDDRDPVSSLCLASVDLLGVAGAGLALMSSDRSLACVGVSDRVTEAVEQMEYTVGEGPCLAAYRTKTAIFDADLADEEHTTRWPEFRRAALTAGVRAAFGFPLLVDQICLGALNLYDTRPGALTDDQCADAVVIARLATRTVLDWQSVASPGTVAWQLERTRNDGVQVHQATGRISVQVGISLADALVLLRAYAFSEGRPISDVAADVAVGRLRFD